MRILLVLNLENLIFIIDTILQQLKKCNSYLIYNCNIISMTKHSYRRSFQAWVAANIMAWCTTLYYLISGSSLISSVIKHIHSLKFKSWYFRINNSIIQKRTYGGSITGDFLIFGSLITWSIRDFGSWTGNKRVFPRCWLNWRHHASA